MEDRNIQISPFLKRLPLEIRTEVYRNLLSTQYTKRLSVSQQSPIHAKLWPGHAYHMDPTILRTSRQVYNEALTVLYDENLFVRIRSTNKSLGRLKDSKGIPHLLEGSKAEIFKHCAMSVDIDRLDRLNTAPRIKRQEDKPCYVIAANDLQPLCESLLIQHTVVNIFLQDYIFRILIHRMFDDTLCKNPAQNSPQRRLLEPFNVLHSVPHFEIAGPANTEYCASIATNVSRMSPTAEDCLKEVKHLMDRGRENLGRNDLEGALKVYKITISQLMCTCRITGTDLTSEQHSVAIDTYLSLLVHFAFLHYRLEEVEDAHFWACRSTRFRLDTSPMPTENCYAKLVYLKATSSARLGEQRRAVEELCEGLDGVSQEAYEDKELVAMRREARHHLKGFVDIKLLKAMGFGRL